VLLDEGKSAFKGHHLSNGGLGKFLAQADKGSYRGYAFLVEEQDRLPAKASWPPSPSSGGF
jgi:hypothetical protein